MRVTAASFAGMTRVLATLAPYWPLKAVG